MKFSFKTLYSRLVLLAFFAIILLMLGGHFLSTPTNSMAGLSWTIFHRHLFVTIVEVLMLGMLFIAWQHHRDDPILLPLSSVVVALFFMQILTDPGNNFAQSSKDLFTYHSITATIVFLALLSLVIAAGILSRKHGKEYPPIEVKQRLKDFVLLSKPIIIFLLLVTTYAGMVVGGRAFPSLSLTFWTLVGGGLTASGSAVINQYIDRNLDKLMQRTANRPLPDGRMFPSESLAFGLSISIVGVYFLVVYVNLLAAILSIAGLLYYVVLYSLFLKKASVYNIVIGGGAGAIPPLVGWAAATGSLDISAWALFALIFFWTPPHFWALAIVRRKEYEKVAIPMLPVVRGEEETRKQILIYTIGLVLLTLLIPLISVAGTIYFVSAILLGGGLIYAAWRVYTIPGNKVAWQMYRISSMYLGFIFVALMIDAVV